MDQEMSFDDMKTFIITESSKVKRRIDGYAGKVLQLNSPEEFIALRKRIAGALKSTAEIFDGPEEDIASTDYEKALAIATVLGGTELEATNNGSLPVVWNEDFVKYPQLADKTSVDWISPWFSIRNKCTLVYTREKAGKSTLLTADAVEAAKNGQKVLWVSGEEFEDEIGRRLAKYGNLPEGSLGVVAGWPTSGAQLEGLIQRTKPDMVVIDSLTSLMASMGERIPSSKDFIGWQKLVLPFKKLAKHYNTSVVLIHHAAKAGDYIGSVGIGQAIDGVISLHRIKDHIYKEGKKGQKVIDIDAEEAALADGDDLLSNTTQVNYGKLRGDLDMDSVLLQYDPKTGKVTESTQYNINLGDLENFVATQLVEGPKTRDEIINAAKSERLYLDTNKFYKIKNTLKLNDIAAKGKYEPSEICYQLAKGDF